MYQARHRYYRGTLAATQNPELLLFWLLHTMNYEIQNYHTTNTGRRYRRGMFEIGEGRVPFVMNTWRARVGCEMVKTNTELLNRALWRTCRQQTSKEWPWPRTGDLRFDKMVIWTRKYWPTFFLLFSAVFSFPPCPVVQYLLSTLTYQQVKRAEK